MCVIVYTDQSRTVDLKGKKITNFNQINLGGGEERYTNP